MPTIDVRVDNLPQIRAAFKRAPELMTMELNKAIGLSGLLIQRQAVQYAPVDTGRLWKSIGSKFENLKGTVGSGVLTGAPVNYDIYVQLGTKFQDAQPYLFSAVADSEAAVIEFFHKAVQNVLDKIGDTV